MAIAVVASPSRSREISASGRKPMLRGIHHLALVTDNMRMTLDFYVRVLGMPIVHGLRTPSRPPGASHTHGNGAPPSPRCCRDVCWNLLARSPVGMRVRGQAAKSIGWSARL
jgi:Glyoxalase/Bleomycin resistance protein/Dioxygenase superfamily